MGADPPSPAELGRRIAAARSYRSVDQIPLARKLGTDPGTLGRYEKGQIPTLKREGLVERCVKELKLPEEFFTISFDELPLMARAWRQAQRLPRPEDLEQILDDALGEQPPE